MGRHSRGGADGTPPPPPEPARHPYAPRSVEDTGTWDRSTYRVVDVGLPTDAPVSFPLNGSRPGTQAAGPSRAAARIPGPYPDQPHELTGTRDVNGGRTALRSVAEADTALRPPAGPSRYGATRADLAAMTELRYGATREPGAPRYGATRADLAEPRPEPERHPIERHPADRLSTDRLSTDRLPTDRHPAGRLSTERLSTERLSTERLSAERRPTERHAVERHPAERHPAERHPAERHPDERYGATRADLAESVGATALAPRPEPRTDPDEVTDTGARRARSAFHLAPEAERSEDDEPADDEPEEDYDEPSLLLQWGVFVAQTLTGAVAGLGVWLGFYRLWSTYPFYAAPAVGAATIVMLVLARTLRRRHGHDLDLMTAIVTIGVATVLTVLPAAFTLQHLA
ncbi:MAG TPA: hypothetical protein VI357_12785 [Mycobacteriales bacterium]